MQWNSKKNAGFSTAPASKLYLPLDPVKTLPTVEAQERDKRSLLNFVRRLARLRNEIPALSGDGEFLALYAKPKKYPFVYLRSLGEQKIIVAVNPSKTPAKISLHPSVSTSGITPIFAAGAALHARNGKLHLEMKGVSYGIFRVA